MSEDPFTKIRKMVIVAGNVLTVRMQLLAEAADIELLLWSQYPHISERLRNNGIEHSPLSLNVEDEVRLFINGSEIHKLIKAVDTVGREYDKLLLSYINRDNQKKTECCRTESVEK